MNTTALVFMIVTQLIITGITLYFFLKVLFIKPKVDVNEDSYTENDEQKNNESK